MNRGQADINKKTTMQEARRREAEFFSVREAGGGGSQGGQGSAASGRPGARRGRGSSSLAAYAALPVRSCHTLPPPTRAQSSEAYRDLDNIGTTYLANKLSNHLIAEITRKLPEIQSYIDKT